MSSALTIPTNAASLALPLLFSLLLTTVDAKKSKSSTNFGKKKKKLATGAIVGIVIAIVLIIIITIITIIVLRKFMKRRAITRGSDPEAIKSTGHTETHTVGHAPGGSGGAAAEYYNKH